MGFAQEIAHAVKNKLFDARYTSRVRHGVAPVGSGRIFFVMPTTKTNYVQFAKDHPAYLSSDGVVTAPAVYNTIAAAVAACTANQGDIIFVCEGHTETVTATSINLSIAGITVIGLGSGKSKPVLTYGAAAATITVSAANVKVTNLFLLANFANVAAAFTTGAAKDCVIDRCEFVDTDSTHNFLSCVVTDAIDNDADGLTFTNNYVYSLPTTDGAVVSILANTLRLNVSDNIADKAATNDAGHMVTLSSKIIGGARILRNILTVVGSSGAAVGIFLTGSGSTSSGVVGFNNVWSLDTTGGLLMTASTGLRPMQNYLSGAVDKSGTLSPVADDPA